MTAFKHTSDDQNQKRTLKSICMIPTYNERENIDRLIEQILELNVQGHDLHALVVDDNSPDGTSDAVKQWQIRSPKIHLLTRFDKKGRGSAGIDGFKRALELGADYVIEMDADFSHDPKYIPSLLKAADSGADLVIGSRFIDGGADEDRGLKRRLLTKAARFYINSVLNLNLKDLTGGYRCFKRNVLEAIGLDQVEASGPSIILETLYKTVAKGFRVAEVPIIFIDRRAGTSKLGTKALAECLFAVVKLRTLKETGKLFGSHSTLIGLLLIFFGLVPIIAGGAANQAQAASSKSITFKSQALYPEGVEFNARAKEFFVSSLKFGRIGIVNMKGQYRVFSDDADLISTIGLRIDRARERLYACVSDPGPSVRSTAQTKGKLARLVVFDLKTNQKIKTIDLGSLADATAPHFCNDIALEAVTGDLYITDSFSPIIYKVDASLNASVFLKSDQFVGEGFNLNGIVVHPAGFLLVSKYNDGSLWKIDLKNPTQITPVPLTASTSKGLLPGADGLIYLSDNELILIQNSGHDQIHLIRAQNTWSKGSVQKSVKSLESFPTTGIRMDRDFFILNGKLDELFSKGEKAQAKSFEIQKVRF